MGVVFHLFLLARSFLLCGWAVGRNLKVREMVMELFASVFFEEALALVPRCTFKVEAMDPYAFSWVHKVFTINSGVISDEYVTRSSYIDLLLYSVKGPVVCSMCSGDLLADTS